MADFSDSYQEEMFLDGEDPFAIEEEIQKESTKGGLIEAAQQNALAELANVIFEDEG